MSDLRVGIGYDSHRFVKGRRLVLGGIEVPHEFGLDGHSDADAVLHAISDAMLGALGKGDIGEHFPDTDPRYQDADSSVLLKQVYELAAGDGYRVGNVDAVVILQEPKIKVFKTRMAERIAGILRVEPCFVNIKAKTNEGMGHIGRGEGIACYATVTLQQMT
ncbi:MAG: 2-C-methyl-D-erythritol 2,4-cyclodiphosphate synthase [Candidatus Omnitrophota bacterium]